MPRQLELRQGADHPVDEPASPVEKERGGAAHAVLGWGEAVLIDVQKDELGTARVFRRELLDDRGYALAVAALGGIELNEDSPLEAEYLCGECAIRGIDRSIGEETHERHGGFAAAAYGPAVPPPVGGNPVLCPAVGAAGDQDIGGHG